MSEDHLDRDVSVGAELTPSGLNVKARSRFIAAVDRLCGNAVEYLNVPMERRHTVERAKIEGEKQLIEAMTKAAVDRMGKDPDFAERAIRNQLGLSIERQENKDGVVRHAIEDLNRNPTAEDASEALDKSFLNKFQRHAEDAATEELREKWGRVLGAEIRAPGTVTSRVMRIVDEIDPETARLFENLCRSRLANVAPTCLAGDLDLRTISKLAGSGLIIDPGITGHIRQFAKMTDDQGKDLWFSDLGRRGLGFPRTAVINLAPGKETPLQMAEEFPAISAYVITDEGLALSSILDDHEQSALDRFLASVRSKLPTLPMTVYEKRGTQWAPLIEVPLASDNSP
jgi:hypothetical protein